MSIADKLTKSVRQAKEKTAGEDSAEAHGSNPKLAQEGTPEAKTPGRSSRPKRGKMSESDGPITPFPSRRVWPD